MSNVRHAHPEPNYDRPVTNDDLARIAVSAHALRRFAQRLQPGIAGADHVAESMARLEDLGSGNRKGHERGRLNRYRHQQADTLAPQARQPSPALSISLLDP
jgi:hypothetical protein